MEKVDVVVVGAEGVAESGGIINKVCYNSHKSSTCTVTALAQSHNHYKLYLQKYLCWI